MKRVLTITLFASLMVCGCRSVKGRTYPVYFTTDATLHADSTVFVHTVDLIKEGNKYVPIELREGDTATGWISGPTFIRKGYSEDVLLYPGEHLHISGDSRTDDYQFSVHGATAQRQRELEVMKLFQQLKKYPPIPRLPDYTLQDVLTKEKEVKDAIPKTEALSQRLLDSLLTVYKVSDKFRALTKDYIKNRYDFGPMWVYRLYKDTLEAYGLYHLKLRSLIEPFNTIKNRRDFTNNSRRYLDQLLPDLFPKNLMWSMPDEEMFRSCFDSIHSNFTGIAREYLLSRVMARAYAKDVVIPKSYVKRYKKASSRKGYRNMVKIAKEEREKKETDTASVESLLLSLDIESNFSFEAFLASQKGKYVLVDFWASWCMPCLQEMPDWKRLMNSYPADNIYFLSLSIDDNTINWRNKIKQRDLQSLNHYLLLNHSNATLTRQYNIETIPRYLLFDKEGKILNADAPKPSDPALKQLLDSLLLIKHTF